MRLKIVENWRKGWRWFSVWAFALIVFFATTPLPPEVVAILPKPLADNLIVLVAVCGLILRFVQQSDPANIKYRIKNRYGGKRAINDKSQDDDG